MPHLAPHNRRLFYPSKAQGIFFLRFLALTLFIQGCFSIPTHASELARIHPDLESKAGRIHLARLAGGLGRNRDHFAREAGGIRFDPAVDPVMQAILFDPQTSGGLLFAVDPTRAKAFRAAFAAANLPLAQIGEVIGGAGIGVAP